MIRFFNTYSRQLEEFAPRDPPNVSMYTCGPTVYSHAHIGNFRAYIFEDLLQRHLETRGFKIHRVMNITDVDDKTIRGAREAKVSLNDFTEPFKRGFFEDLKTLRIKRADEYPGATEPRYLARMIEMISELIKRGLAYQTDIHCGGVDNIFPHHEAEIAQSEGVTGRKFVCYWLHCAHLLVDNQKMSKSLGNFYTLRDVTAKGYSGREVRYALLRVHYRAQLNFTFEGMEESRQALTRIDEWLQRLRETSARVSPGKRAGPVPANDFQSTLDDDLNISGALGVLFESIRETNRAMDAKELDADGAKVWLQWWEDINQVLALEATETMALPSEIETLAEARRLARLANDWQKSDELRRELNARGWELRDTKDGQKITRRVGIKP